MLNQDTPIEVADRIRSLLDANTDAQYVSLLRIHLEISRSSPAARGGFFPFKNNAGPEKAVNNHGNRSGAKPRLPDEIGARNGLPISDDMEKLQLICFTEVFDIQHPQRAGGTYSHRGVRGQI